MIANNPVFVWLFLTAWIWAGFAAYFLHRIGKGYGKFTTLARGAEVLFGMIAIQSGFWFVGCGAAYLFTSGWVSYAQAFHWLFTSQGCMVWWGVSFVATLIGVVREVRDDLANNRNFGNGIGDAIGLTFAGMVVYWLYLLFAYLVSIIVVLG